MCWILPGAKDTADPTHFIALTISCLYHRHHASLAPPPARGGPAPPRPAERPGHHHVPPDRLAARLGAGPDVRAVPGPVLRGRPRRLPHGRRGQGLWRDLAGRHAHRGPAGGEG